ERFLATILFVDLVRSTERINKIGDAAWKQLLAKYYAEARRELAIYGGVEVDTAGDGLLAHFDGPGKAVKCAGAIERAARELGLDGTQAVAERLGAVALRASVEQVAIPTDTRLHTRRHRGEEDDAEGSVPGRAGHRGPALRVAGLADRAALHRSVHAVPRQHRGDVHRQRALHRRALPRPVLVPVLVSRLPLRALLHTAPARHRGAVRKDRRRYPAGVSDRRGDRLRPRAASGVPRGARADAVAPRGTAFRSSLSSASFAHVRLSAHPIRRSGALRHMPAPALASCRARPVRRGTARAF